MYERMSSRGRFAIRSSGEFVSSVPKIQGRSHLRRFAGLTEWLAKLPVGGLRLAFQRDSANGHISSHGRASQEGCACDARLRPLRPGEAVGFSADVDVAGDFERFQVHYRNVVVGCTGNECAIADGIHQET
jgi:hypothetical protein